MSAVASPEKVGRASSVTLPSRISPVIAPTSSVRVMLSMTRPEVWLSGGVLSAGPSITTLLLLPASSVASTTTSLASTPAGFGWMLQWPSASATVLVTLSLTGSVITITAPGSALPASSSSVLFVISGAAVLVSSLNGHSAPGAEMFPAASVLTALIL
ncbi:hypothetical protein BW31_03059 [Pantoea agglomerans]|nr:hypothetical protein BW31_03059 [Pantoea agglomerans]